VLAIKLLKGEFGEGQTVEVGFGDGGLVFSAVAAPETVEEAQAHEQV